MALLKRLPPPKNCCDRCHTALDVGEPYQTHLHEEKGGWKREDYCLNCLLPAERPIGWRGKVKKRQNPPVEEKLLTEFYESSDDPIWATFLAEALIRKGVFKRRAQKGIEVASTGEIFIFEPTLIPREELPLLQERLERTRAF